MATTKKPSSLYHRGSILLEGLIAILIFSVGILALMAMLGTAVKISSDSKYRADASYLANQLIGVMWTDRASGNFTTYAHYPTAGASACTPGGIASGNANVTAWLADVQNLLPGAAANRQQIAIGTNNVVTVTICWQAPEETAPHNYVATAQIVFN